MLANRCTAKYAANRALPLASANSLVRHNNRLKSCGRALPLSMEDAATYKQSVQQMFDRSSQRYDEQASFDFHDPLALTLVEVSNIQPGENVLDIASGTGLVSLRAAKLVGPIGTVTALDLSQGMLQKQQAKAHAEGVGNVQILQGDVETIQLPARSFDVITCCSSLPYFNDISLVLQRCTEWLKPGPHSRLAFQCFQAPMNEDYGLLCQLAQEHGIQLIEPNQRCGNQQACEQLCHTAGYRVTNFVSENRVQFNSAESVEEYAQSIFSRAVKSPFWPHNVSVDGEQANKLKETYLSAVLPNAAKRFTCQNGRHGVAVPFVSLYIVARPAH